MSKTSLVFTIVGTYCILVTVIGIMAKKSKDTSEDYFLASRKVVLLYPSVVTAGFYSAYLFWELSASFIPMDLC